MNNKTYPITKDKLADFSFLIDMYALADDNILYDDGIKLKNLVIKHVEEFYEKYKDEDLV